LCVPTSRSRAFISPDGTLSVSGGPSLRIRPAGRPGAKGVRPEGALPLVEWRETWSRFRARMSAFVGTSGAFLRVEIENPYREPRRLAVEAVVSGPPSMRGARLEGGTLRGAGGEALVSFAGAAGTSGSARAALAGADVSLARVRSGEARVGIDLVLPARGMRVVEAVLGPRGRTRASSLGPALAEAHVAWDSLRDSLASAHLPDEALQAGFDRALAAVVGAISPGEDSDSPWPRPGFPPAVGPATEDARAMRALDLWGGGRIVEQCLHTAFAAQGQAAPPGKRFVSASGFLSAPTDDRIRDMSAADCGAILEAASARADVGAPLGYFRRARAGIVAACEWIIGALDSEGVLPPARRPRQADPSARREGRLWTDRLTWRGLDSAAGCLERIGARQAPRVRAAAEQYARSIERKWGISPGQVPPGRQGSQGRQGRPSLAYSDVLGVLAVPGREILSGALDAEIEFRKAVHLLWHLRQVLLREEDGVLRIFPSAPREWLDPGARLEFERLPTSVGPVSVGSFAFPRGDRIIAEVELPRAATSGGSALKTVELRLGPPVGRALREVRVNGRRSRRFKPRAGTIALSPRRFIEVEVVLSKARR